VIEASSLRGRAINPLLYQTKCAGWWRLRHNAGYIDLFVSIVGWGSQAVATLFSTHGSLSIKNTDL
jgi:hypothetical protein